MCVCGPGWDSSGEGCRMGGEAANPSDSPPHTLPPNLDLWSERSCSLELDVLNQAAGPSGKCCLSVWNFIIFNYLDHDGSRSPSLPLPPFQLVTQTLAFPSQLTCLSVRCLPLCFLPFPVLPHPCLLHQLTFLTSATFLYCALPLCGCVIFFFLL